MPSPPGPSSQWCLEKFWNCRNSGSWNSAFESGSCSPHLGQSARNSHPPDPRPATHAPPAPRACPRLGGGSPPVARPGRGPGSQAPYPPAALALEAPAIPTPLRGEGRERRGPAAGTTPAPARSRPARARLELRARPRPRARRRGSRPGTEAAAAARSRA